MNVFPNPRLRQALFYALALVAGCWFLAAWFDIPATLHEANASKTILVENISGQENSTVYLGYVKQNYRMLPLADFATESWMLGPLPGSALQTLTSARAGDPLQVQIPMAGSTQFVFITASEAGQVRITDLETGRASELDLQAVGHYTVTHSTISGTKRAWDLFLVSLALFVGLSTVVAMGLKGWKWKDALQVWNDPAHAPLTFAIIGMTLLLNNLFMTQRLFFFGDSKGYWDNAPTFVRDGVFALGNVDTLYSFRGYLMSLIAFFPRWLGGRLGLEAVLVYVLFLAFIYSLFFILVVPKLIRWLMGREARPYQVLIVFALTGFFWMGWFTWLLTDLLSLGALLSGLVLLVDGIGKRRWAALFASGIFMGIAINLRANYELDLAVLLLVALQLLYKERQASAASLTVLARRFLLIAALVASGIILVSLPQAQLNWQKYHKASLFPFSAENWFESNLETHDTVLEYGLAIGRLKTQIWPYPYPNLIGISTLYRYFGLDPVALQDFQVAGDMLHQQGGMNVPLYLDLARRYPLEFTVDIFLKVFTGLNNQSFEPYPVNWRAGLPVALFSFFNYSVLFLAFLVFWQYLSQFVRDRRASLHLIFWYALLALPALPFVIMAVEWRYFLPLYFGFYLLLVTTERETYAKIFSDKLWPLQFFLFLLVCYSLTTLVTPAYLD